MSEKTRGFLKPLVPHFDVARPLKQGRLFDQKGPVVIEIGFGLGEVLAQEAKANPRTNYIGVETSWERIIKTLKRLEREGVTAAGNVRLFRLDATVLFERYIRQRSIEHAFSFFPCPWPKKKHEKYRLFSRSSLQLVNSRLKDNATLRIVTDHYPYVRWIEEQNINCGFSLVTRKIRSQFDTKFEKKWRNEGQEAFFEVTLKKTGHVPVKVKRDIIMKSYKLSAFDPQRFVIRELKDKATIVPRGTFFDAQKQVMFIQALVAEENLTQDFWATIIKKNNGWLLKKAEGHYFFPTPGVAMALEHIYEQARLSSR